MCLGPSFLKFCLKLCFSTVSTPSIISIHHLICVLYGSNYSNLWAAHQLLLISSHCMTSYLGCSQQCIFASSVCCISNFSKNTFLACFAALCQRCGFYLPNHFLTIEMPFKALNHDKRLRHVWACTRKHKCIALLYH